MKNEIMEAIKETFKNYVIIEYRCAIREKLHDVVFDEPEFYIQREINRMKESGNTELKIVQNPKNFNLVI
jgi:hypothetical protein